MYIISILALIFSVTNLVYASILPLLLFPLAFVALFVNNLIVPKYIYILWLLILYIIISTFFYDKTALLDFSFYRRDGNFFIAYGIFFTICMLGIKKDPREDIKKSLFIICIASVIGFFVGHNEGGLVHFFLFEAHNAAGGFYGVMTALSIGFFIQNRSKIYLFYSALFGICLLTSDSRGTLLALVITGLLYFFLRFKKPFVYFIGLVVGHILILSWTYPLWVQSGKPIEIGVFEGNLNVDNVNRGGTIVDRVMNLWPRAVDNFLNSPIVGQGFGSYDDRDYTYIEILPFLSVKHGQMIQHSDSHAHNSFLNILAELGLAGFIIFLVFFILIYKEIEKVDFWAKDLSLALKFAFWVCIFSSATEHRLTTPSQMIPFFIILALALSYTRYLNIRNKYLK